MRKFMLFFTLLVATSLASASNVTPDRHVVSPEELQGAVNAAAAERDSNRDTLQKFFASSTARKALTAANINYEQVQRAVAQISDEEAAQFASRVHQVEQDFAAGELTNQQITYILIALAAAVIVLILV